MLKINYDLIEKSLRELENICLFTEKRTNLEYIIEYYDFDECKELAYDYDEYFIDDEYYTWNDLKELEMEKIREIIYKHENYKIINEELRKIGIRNISKMAISNECKEVWDDIYNDLINCIKVRAVIGEKDNFFEKIFQVYLSGGWPFGWDGDYPNGKLKVYYLK